MGSATPRGVGIDWGAADLAIPAAVRAALQSASGARSSEYAYPTWSPERTRTPMPRLTLVDAWFTAPSVKTMEVELECSK